MTGKSPMSTRNTVVLATSESVAPQSPSTAATLASAWRVWAATPPSARLPVAGSIPTWPASASQSPARAAEATLGNTPSVTNGRGGAEQEPGKSAQNHQEVDGEHADAEASLDVAELRRAATSARAADDVLARAASEAAERPLPNETLQG